MRSIQLAVACLAICLASCSKEKTDAPLPSAEKKVKTILFTDAGAITEKLDYVYDAKGRISQIGYDITLDDFSYDENNSKIYIKSALRSDPTQYRNSEITLNAKGATEKKVERYQNGNLYHQKEIEYDENGVMKKMILTDPFNPLIGYEMYELVNGEITKTSFYSGAQLKSWTSFTYDLSKTIKGYRQWAKVYTNDQVSGKVTTHPIATAKAYNAAGQLIRDDVYTYEYYATGEVAKITITDILSGDVSKIEFSYY